jgi:hypothetical protein
MRVIFVYTDSNAPSCVSASGIVKVEEATVNNQAAIQVTNTGGNVTTFYKSQGQLALLWE